MPGKTRFMTDAVLNVLRGTNITAPTTVYVGLLSVVPPDDNSAGTELSGSGYARQAVTFSAPATDSGNVRKIENSGAVTFGPATADWTGHVAFGVFDALAAGNMTHWDYLLGDRKAFNADAATDTLTATAHGLANGNRVKVVNTGGTLPGGLAAGTTYFVVGSTANTFQLSATLGGAAINITDAGLGLNQVALDYAAQNLLGGSVSFGAATLRITED